MTTLLHVDHMYKYYGVFCAAKDITFEVPEGQVVGFLGPNGAGKTTSMRVITGYFPPSRGTVHVDGINIVQDPLAVRAKIGYLPESNPLYPELTIREYLRFRAQIKNVPAKEVSARVDAAMAATDCAKRARQVIGTLSKGFRQRVGLADAIVAKPRLLVLDEPTSGLDPVQQIEVRKLIRGIAEHATVVLSTHILQEVEKVCDRILIIHRGEMIPESEVEARKRSREYRLVVRGPREALEASFQPVVGGGVVCSYLGAKNSDEHVWRFEPPSGEDLREPLAKAVASVGQANAETQLLELVPVQVGLEKVFSEVINRSVPEWLEDPAAVAPHAGAEA